jgi:hypothetical protein
VLAATNPVTSNADNAIEILILTSSIQELYVELDFTKISDMISQSSRMWLCKNGQLRRMTTSLRNLEVTDGKNFTPRRQVSAESTSGDGSSGIAGFERPGSKLPFPHCLRRRPLAFLASSAFSISSILVSISNSASLVAPLISLPSSYSGSSMLWEALPELAKRHAATGITNCELNTIIEIDMGISGLLLVSIASLTTSTLLNFCWNLAAFVYAKTVRRSRLA